MLEYCPNGNLRSYLIDYEKELKKSLKYYSEKAYLEPTAPAAVAHDLKLLCVWACQVKKIILCNFVILVLAEFMFL